MPQVMTCDYCYQEIDLDNQKWLKVPSLEGHFAHLDCYTKENAPGRPSQSTPPYRV